MTTRVSRDSRTGPDSAGREVASRPELEAEEVRRTFEEEVSGTSAREHASDG